MNPFPLATQSESNRADIRDYLRRELAIPLQKRSDADRLVDQILEKSKGVFLSNLCFASERNYDQQTLTIECRRSLGDTQ